MHIYNLLAILPPYTTLHVHSDTEQWTTSVNKLQKDESLSSLKYAKI